MKEKNLKDKKDKNIAELEKKVLELENSWKRALADYKNLRRRVDEDRARIASYASYEFIKKLLPVIDDFEKVRENTKDEGVAMAVDSLKRLLKQEGVEEIDLAGEKFDPSFCEAVEIEEGEEGKITRTLSKGYVMKGKVLRPARVVVGKKFTK